MSLINQVLKDLDKRGANTNIGEATIRVVHGRSGHKTFWLLVAGAAGMLIIIVASWLLWQTQHHVVVIPPSVPLQPVTTLAASQPVAVPVQKTVPIIDSVSPETILATGTNQTIIINGSNFDEGASVNLYEEGGEAYADRPITSLTPRQIVMKLNFGKLPNIWTIEVVGADGSSSDLHTIAVTAPTASTQPATPVVAATAPLTSKPNKANARTEKISVPQALPGIIMQNGVNKQPTQISLQQQADNEFRRAYQLMREGRNSEALAGYEAALKLDPGHDLARQTMVSLLLEKKNIPEAERVLHEGLNNNIKQSNFAMLLARLQVERNALPQALDTLMHTLPYADKQPDYLAFVAALMQRQNRHKEAIEYYGKALQIKPQSGVWMMGMGISLRAEKQNAEAREIFKRALDSNTLNAELQSFVTLQLKEL